MRYDFWRQGSMKLPDISYSSIAYSLLVTAFSPTQKTPPKIKKQRPSVGVFRETNFYADRFVLKTL